MESVILAAGQLARKMAMGSSSSKMASASTRDSSTIISSMVKANTTGTAKADMLAIGRIMSVVVVAVSSGRMASDIRANSDMIRCMVLECFSRGMGAVFGGAGSLAAGKD